MKKKIVIALFIMTLGATVIGCGKSNNNSNVPASDKQSVSSDKSDDKSSTEDDFVWTADGMISGLSDSGKKQDKIVIPKKCKGILGVLVTKDSSVKEISFEGDIPAEFKSWYISEGDSSLEKISYPEGLETIESTSLTNEKSLKEIVFPSTLLKIDDYALGYCDSLEKVDLTNTKVTYIGKLAFEECNSIKEVYLPETIKEIGQFAFPKSVTDIYIPENAELTSYAEDNVLLANETDVKVHVKEGSWADSCFDTWFNGDPKYTKVYD